MAVQIMKNAGVSPQETVMVGDGKGDMQMARNAGIEPIAVLTGLLTKDEAITMGVTHIVENVTLIEPVVQHLSAHLKLLHVWEFA
jgi:phosphoglycolate phosphatase